MIFNHSIWLGLLVLTIFTNVYSFDEWTSREEPYLVSDTIIYNSVCYSPNLNLSNGSINPLDEYWWSSVSCTEVTSVNSDDLMNNLNDSLLDLTSTLNFFMGVVLFFVGVLIMSFVFLAIFMGFS